MKKLVARVLVLLLACIWTRPVAEGTADSWLPRIGNAIRIAPLDVPWEFKGWRAVRKLEIVPFPEEKSWKKVEADYARLFAGLRTEAKESSITVGAFSYSFNMSDAKTLTELALNKGWLMPVGVKWSVPRNRYEMVRPVLDGMINLQKLVNSPKYLAIGDELAIARKLLEPLRKMHKYDTRHGNVSMKSIVVARPTLKKQRKAGQKRRSGEEQRNEEQFKVMKTGTKLLLTEFNRMDLKHQRNEERVDALGIAMIFGGFREAEIKGMRSIVETNYKSIINESDHEKVMQANIELLAVFSEIGGSEDELGFWKDAKLGEMEPDMKAVWMFATLAALPRGTFTFDDMAAYLWGHGDVQRFVQELRTYARYLTRLGTKSKVWKNVLFAHIDESQKNKISNIFYSALHDIQNLHKASVEFEEALVYAFTFTFMFSAVEDKLDEQTVVVTEQANGEWCEYLKTTGNAEKLKEKIKSSKSC
eukprot:GHVS01050479.1.p1 GENE.GHVS01050479.1~~GHVS01050479.1.p1  ORF type:complete len:475 (+),score=37.92 GHVS01050479.1:40-1464(+)